MSIFGSIRDRIFGHQPAQAPAATPGAAAAPTPAAAPATAPAPAPVSTPVSAPAAAVDVGAVLSEMAALHNGGGNYQQSIVDLLKLLDLDSSLAARTALAQELGVHAGADGSAEQNIALHQAVMAKLAEHGGIVPDSLRNG